MQSTSNCTTVCSRTCKNKTNPASHCQSQKNSFCWQISSLIWHSKSRISLILPWQDRAWISTSSSRSKEVVLVMLKATWILSNWVASQPQVSPMGAVVLLRVSSTLVPVILSRLKKERYPKKSQQHLSKIKFHIQKLRWPLQFKSRTISLNLRWVKHRKSNCHRYEKPLSNLYVLLQLNKAQRRRSFA